MGIKFVMTLLIGTAGGLIARKHKITAGLLIGALVSVAIFNIATGEGVFFSQVKTLTQIISGGIIGSTVTRDDVVAMKYIIKPAAFMVSMMLLINFAIGNFVYHVSDIDLMTSLLCTIPGGLTDITIMSGDLGGDVPTVAIMHVIRLVSVLCIFPTLIKVISKKFGVEKIENSEEPTVKPKKTGTKVQTAKTLAIAIAGGYIGLLTKIPAGTIIFSMLFVSFYNVMCCDSFIDKRVKYVAQVFCGAFIGCQITLEYVLNLKNLIVPAIIIVVCYVLFNITLGLIMSKLFKMDIPTALFACTPAGVSDMALIAEELTDDSAKVAILQIIRLVSAVSIFPQLIILFVKYVG